MAFQPIGFPGRTVRAKDHGALFASLMGDGWVDGCPIIYTNRAFSIGEGWFVACGRLINNNATINTTVITGSGYAQLVLVIDATNEGSVSIVERSASSPSGFPALSQGDINNGASTYEMELCVISIDENAVYRRWSPAARPVYVTTAAPTSSSPDGIYLVTES